MGDGTAGLWRALQVGVAITVAMDRPPPPSGFALGLGELDLLTGPLRPGDVWVVLGSAGDGVSMLGLQIAVTAALQWELAATVVGNHLPIAVQCARVLAQCGGPALPHTVGSASGPVADERFARSRRRVATSRLYLANGMAGLGEDCAAAVALSGGGAPPDVLVVDTIGEELPVCGNDGPAVLRSLVEACRVSGTALVLCERRVGHAPRGRLHLSARLIELADVVVEVGDPEGRPVGPMLRGGEAQLRVQKNRWGPRGRVHDVVEQFHRARFAASVSA